MTLGISVNAYTHHGMMPAVTAVCSHMKLNICQWLLAWLMYNWLSGLFKGSFLAIVSYPLHLSYRIIKAVSWWPNLRVLTNLQSTLISGTILYVRGLLMDRFQLSTAQLSRCLQISWPRLYTGISSRHSGGLSWGILPKWILLLSLLLPFLLLVGWVWFKLPLSFLFYIFHHICWVAVVSVLGSIFLPVHTVLLYMLCAYMPEWGCRIDILGHPCFDSHFRYPW